MENRLNELGVKVQRQRKVTALTPADNGKGIKASFEDGSDIEAMYVVGADGSRSTVSVSSPSRSC